jgi:hypothetical protein
MVLGAARESAARSTSLTMAPTTVRGSIITAEGWESGQVEQGGKGAPEPLVAQGQPAEPALEPGEEALHRRPGHPVGGPAEAIGPATFGPRPPPGVRR